GANSGKSRKIARAWPTASKGCSFAGLRLSVAPQPVETGRVHLRVACGVLDVGVTEIGREAQRIHAGVDQFEAAGGPQQVRMHIVQPGLGCGLFEELVKPVPGHRCATRGLEYEARSGRLLPA